MKDLKTILYLTIHGAKKSVAEIADDIGRSASVLYRYALDGESGAPMPAELLIPLMKATADYRILQHMAASCDFALVRLKRASVLKTKDPAVVNEIQARFSRIIADFCSFSAQATDAETLEMLDQIDTHLSDMVSMRRAVKGFKQGDLF